MNERPQSKMIERISGRDKNIRRKMKLNFSVYIWQNNIFFINLKTKCITSLISFLKLQYLIFDKFASLSYIHVIYAHNLRTIYQSAIIFVECDAYYLCILKLHAAFINSLFYKQWYKITFSLCHGRSNLNRRMKFEIFHDIGKNCFLHIVQWKSHFCCFKKH